MNHSDVELQSKQVSEKKHYLNPQKIIKTGLLIYVNHFKDYYLIAFKACFWLLIPIYGFAKYLSLNSLISYLTFYEVIEEPEHTREAYQFIESRIWKFFSAAIFIILAAQITLLIIKVILIPILITIAGFISNILSNVFAKFSSNKLLQVYLQNNILNDRLIAIYALKKILKIFIYIFIYILTIGHVLIFDVLLAITENITPFASLKFSKELTQSHISQLSLLTLLETTIIMPFFYLVDLSLSSIIIPFFNKNNQNLWLVFLFLIFYLTISFILLAFLNSYCQVMKAVTTYELIKISDNFKLK